MATNYDISNFNGNHGKFLNVTYSPQITYEYSKAQRKYLSGREQAIFDDN
jgi:hypothetical protein